MLTYETTPETEFRLDLGNSFQPKFFIDISYPHECKLEIMFVCKSRSGINFLCSRADVVVTLGGLSVLSLQFKGRSHSATTQI